MIMECPHCKKKLDVLGRCYINAKQYDNTVYARAECCGKMVVITPVTKFDIQPYTGERTEDDWGLELKR